MPGDEGVDRPVVEVRGVCKRFGHVEALRGADFVVHANEIVALIGDNGAGKSTLAKVLSGVIHPDEGEVLLEGKPVSISTPTAARDLGIETVYQDLSLAPDLDPAANLFLGRELRRAGILGKLGVLDNREMRKKARSAFDQLGVRLQDHSGPVARMSGGQQQGVAVSKAVSWAKRVIVLDEPTAALGVEQTGRVLDLIKRVKDQGRSVVLISHSMPDVLAVADRVEVLRLGRRVARFRAAEATLEDLVGAMTGALA
jgi:simple sugar transport system ATP-binding protein